MMEKECKDMTLEELHTERAYWNGRIAGPDAWHKAKSIAGATWHRDNLDKHIAARLAIDVAT